MSDTKKSAKEAKSALVNLVSASMIKEPAFDMKSFEDPSTSCGKMVQLALAIAEDDGEFILKLALYVRCDLGLRGTANFLTSIAAYTPKAQPFLVAYMQRIVCLPSDWLQIATFARDIPYRETTGLPTSLRKALASTFTKFNEHSLAKYNKEKAQAKKKKRADARGDSDAANAAQPYTLKSMIKTLHIAKPNYYVMAILGKRYPSTAEEFRECGLEAEGRSFDTEKAGTRMRLAVPLTWETQLASRGNHGHVWDELVEAKSLPFMAMLRNLRNIILAGCNKATHDTICFRLTNEDQVAGSKQFPYRFFSAYDVLDIDPEHAYDPPTDGKSNRPSNKPKKIPENAPSPEEIGELLTKYRNALDRAVQLATKCNIRPIHGRTIVMVGVHEAMFNPVVAQGAKGIGSVRSLHEVALLLGVMFKYACEKCDLVLYSGNEYKVIDDLRDGAILKNMETIKTTAEELRTSIKTWPQHSRASSEDCRFPFEFLDGLINNRQQVGALVVIDDGAKDYAENNICDTLGGLNEYLENMRTFCNEELLFVDVDVASKVTAASEGRVFHHANDVCISGFSDSILRFVAERGAGGPLRYVENIAKVYNIDTSSVQLGFDASTFVPDAISEEDESDDDDNMNKPKMFHDPNAVATLATAAQRHLTTVKEVRFFLSSTFVDMHNERNALVLDVFPTVRRMAALKGIKANITEIDFRWGITAEDAAHNSLNICLNEVARCAPFFIGMYGGRRGFTPSLPHSLTPDVDIENERAHFNWLSKESTPRSITELETRQAWVSSSVQGDGPQGMLLMFRDNGKTVASLPDSHKKTFAPENDEAAAAGKEFRNFARTRLAPAKVVSYNATYDSVTDGKVQLKMEEFKRKATKYIWNALTSICPIPDDGTPQRATDDSAKAPTSVAESTVMEQEHFTNKIVSTYVRQKQFFNNAVGFVLGVGTAIPENTSHHLMTVIATEGCGKSAAMAAIAEELRTTQPGTCVVSHYFSVGSGDVASCVEHIITSLVTRLGLEDDFSVGPTLDGNLNTLAALYEAASHHSRIVIMLDGLDSCTSPDILQKALPQLVPPTPPVNSRFIVSLRNHSTLLGGFKARKPAAFPLPIPDLTKSERASLVRNHLREFGKKLQESAAKGNQLLPIIRKQDSGKPAYLMQALTHLRLFSTFDTLNQDIRNLPATISALNNDIIKRFESAYGAGVCGVVLSALALSAPIGGINEADLYRMSPNVALTRRLLNLIHSALLYQDDGSILLINDALLGSIRKKYFGRSADVLNMHQELCTAYIKRSVITKFNIGGGFGGGSMFGSGSSMFGGSLGATTTTAAPISAEELIKISPRALLGAMHHALHGKKYDILETIIQDVGCLERVIEQHLLPQLLNIIADLGTQNKILYKKVEPFADFVIAHRHILLRHPTLVLQCALNMPKTSPIFAAVKNVELGPSKSWIEWCNRDIHGEKECVQTTMVTTQAVQCVAFDEKAEMMAVGGNDWVCRVVKVYDGTIPFKLRHPNTVTAVVFGQNKQLITGCEDGLIRVFSLYDGAMVQTCKSHTRRVNGLALHPTKPTLVSASDDCTGRVWNLGQSQAQLRPFKTLRKHSRPVSCCAMHQSGSTFATASWDGKAIIWSDDKDTFYNVRRGAVRAIAFIPSMVVTLAIATYDGKIDLYDFAAGHASCTLDQHLRRPISSIGFSADAKRMITSDVDGSAKIWRAGVVGEVLGTFIGHAKEVTKAMFSPKDGRDLITASADASIRHWRTGDDDERFGSLHSASITGAVFSKSGKLSVTAGRDGKAHVMDHEDKRYIKFTIDHGLPITAVAITENEAHIITGGVNGSVKVWKGEPGLNGRDGLLEFQTHRHLHAVHDIKCRGTTVVSVSLDGVVHTFDAAMPKVAVRAARCSAKKGPTMTAFWDGAHTVTAVGSFGDVDSIACSSASGWDAYKADNQHQLCVAPRVTQKLHGSTELAYVQCSAASPDGRHIALGSRNGNMVITLQGRITVGSHFLQDELKMDGRPAAINAISWLDDAHIAVGCSDYSVRVYQFTTYKTFKLSQIFFATAPVEAVDCHPASGGIVAGDALGNVYVLQDHGGPAAYSRVSEGHGATVDDIYAMERHHTNSSAEDFLFMDLSDSDDESEYTDASSVASSGAEQRAAELEAANGRFEELMFMVTPPQELKGDEKRAWHMRKQSMLKEAMRAMKHNPRARVAVRFHAERTMKAFSAYSTYLAQ